MTAQWYELKTIINNLSINDEYFRMGYYIMLNKMNEIESKHACKSLEEAGY